MAAKTPPSGFVELQTAQSANKNSIAAVIGVVVDYMPAIRTRTGDLQLTFKLQDYSNRWSGEGLKVRFFKKTPKDLPPIKAIGDVVLLRNIKVNEFAGETLLVSGFQTAHLVFSGASVPSPTFKLDYVSGNSKLPCQGTEGQRNTLGPIEQDYIITLKNELNTQAKAVEGPDPVPAGTSARPAQPVQSYRPALAGDYSRKFKLVKDLQNRVFSDVIIEVVKKFTTMSGNCELYVTDYTENKQMFYYAPPEEKKNDIFRDGDLFGYNGQIKREWPGPYGFMVLKVNLIDPHASFANAQVKEGDVIALENVKIKVMPNDSKLEGDMWPDQNNPTKVQIRKLYQTTPQVTNLRLRKDEYLAARSKLTENVLHNGDGAVEELSKKQKKSKKRRERRLRQAGEEEAAAARKMQVNKHVRCTHADQPYTTVFRILDEDDRRHTNIFPDGTSYTLPFVNARYHIKARVVDFHPPKLQDFAIQLLDTEADDDKSEYSVDMIWEDSTPRWEWSFALQVEEVLLPSQMNVNGQRRAPRRIWLNVSHLEAQHLFGNAVDDPTNLRTDVALLNQLREKLSILWGDLEEKKKNEDEDGRQAKRAKLDDAVGDGEQPSNLPFDCCLQEYGALREGGCAEEATDWERQFMMFGVTIH